MKKKSMIISMVLCMLVLILSFQNVKAQPVTSNLQAYEVVDCWDGTKEWTDNGAKIILPGGVADAWNRRADVLKNDQYGPLFTIKNNEEVSMSFSIKLFGTDGTQISKSNNSSALDIFVMNKANDSEIMLLRIWTDAGGYNNGNHSYEIYPVFGDWGTVIYGSTWIAGDALEDSEFFIQFSKEKLFESFVGGSEEITRLDNSDALLAYRYRLDDVDQVYFRIAGDNGFTANTEITVKSINGQSLANTAGVFEDSQAPIVHLGNVSSTIIEDQAYQIPVNAYDLLSNPITYQILDMEDNVLSNDNTYTPQDSGDKSIKLRVTDSANNSEEVSLDFSVSNTIDVPEISNLPNLTDINSSYFNKIEFDKPTVTDETGVYSLKLNIYNPDDLETPLYVLDKLNQNNKFELVIAEDFISGQYSFVYVAENEAGKAESLLQNITINVSSTYNTDFVNSEAGMSDYIDSGIRLRTTEDTVFTFGEFDINYGFDIKFQVPASSGNLVNNASNGYVELVLLDPKNPLNNITYRVWLDIVNVDNPTNIFIHEDGLEEVDLPNAGWITNSVDEKNMQFHMYFDLDSYFSADRLSGKTVADVGQTEITNFLNKINSDSLVVGLRASSLTDNQYFELLVTEINGQNLESTNGVLDTYADVFLANKTNIENMVLQNKQIDFLVYVNDLYSEVSYTAKVVLPDESELVFDNLTEEFSFTPTMLGETQVIFFATGENGVLVELEPIKFIVKDKVTAPEITLDSNYESSYTLNQSIKIINAIYSEDVDNSSITIIITNPLGEDETVNIGQDYSFVLPGIYKIIYSCTDSATPEPNSTVKDFTINVPDDVLPVIQVNNIPTTSIINKEIVINGIEILDDSSYELVIQITNPDGEKEVITLTDGSIKFTPDKKGEWIIELTVTDLYDNVQTASYSINVKTISTGAIIGIIAGVVVLLSGLFVVLKVSKKA